MTSSIVDRRARRAHRSRLERGDVPGWVMVTLMTAGLVVALWVIAGEQFQRVFMTAIERVLNT